MTTGPRTPTMKSHLAALGAVVALAAAASPIKYIIVLMEEVSSRADSAAVAGACFGSRVA